MLVSCLMNLSSGGGVHNNLRGRRVHSWSVCHWVVRKGGGGGGGGGIHKGSVYGGIVHDCIHELTVYIRIVPS